MKIICYKMDHNDSEMTTFESEESNLGTNSIYSDSTISFMDRENFKDEIKNLKAKILAIQNEKRTAEETKGIYAIYLPIIFLSILFGLVIIHIAYCKQEFDKLNEQNVEMESKWSEENGKLNKQIGQIVAKMKEQEIELVELVKMKMELLKREEDKQREEEEKKTNIEFRKALIGVASFLTIILAGSFLLFVFLFPNTVKRIEEKYGWL